MLRNLINKWQKENQTSHKWNRQFAKAHPKLHACECEPEKLRLILGSARSGTSWLARTLAITQTPLRYCHEFLTYVKPKYYFSKQNDYTSLSYCPKLEDSHPLIKLYKCTTCQDINWEKFLPRYADKKIRRDDAEFELVLHKEVHSLLATEGLVKNLGCPAIIITRNPIYNVDSLFNYQKLSHIIWRNEAEYIQDPQFIERFLPDNGAIITDILRRFPDDGINRENVIISKALTVAAINKMLRIISKENMNIKHIKYENLCASPLQFFSDCAEFLGLSFGEKEREKLIVTLKRKEEKFDPMSINRDTFDQPKRDYYFLTKEETTTVTQLLNDCGLIDDK